jgi:hypothetical protein
MCGALGPAILPGRWPCPGPGQPRRWPGRQSSAPPGGRRVRVRPDLAPASSSSPLLMPPLRRPALGNPGRMGWRPAHRAGRQPVVFGARMALAEHSGCRPATSGLCARMSAAGSAAWATGGREAMAGSHGRSCWLRHSPRRSPAGPECHAGHGGHGRSPACAAPPGPEGSATSSVLATRNSTWPCKHPATCWARGALAPPRQRACPMTRPSISPTATEPRPRSHRQRSDRSQPPDHVTETYSAGGRRPQALVLIPLERPP